MNEYSKYKLFRKYKTEDGVNYTPLDEYQALSDGSINNCDCGYREYEWRISNPTEYACGSELINESDKVIGSEIGETSKYIKYYKWEYCPNNDEYLANTREYNYRLYSENVCDCGYYVYEVQEMNDISLSYDDIKNDNVMIVESYSGWRYTSNANTTTAETSGDIFTIWNPKFNTSPFYFGGSVTINFKSLTNVIKIFSSAKQTSAKNYSFVMLNGEYINFEKGFNYFNLVGDESTIHKLTLYHKRNNTSEGVTSFLGLSGINPNYQTYYPSYYNKVCDGNLVEEGDKFYIENDTIIDIPTCETNTTYAYKPYSISALNSIVEYNEVSNCKVTRKYTATTTNSDCTVTTKSGTETISSNEEPTSVNPSGYNDGTIRTVTARTLYGTYTFKQKPNPNYVAPLNVKVNGTTISEGGSYTWNVAETVDNGYIYLYYIGNATITVTLTITSVNNGGSFFYIKSESNPLYSYTGFNVKTTDSSNSTVSYTFSSTPNIECSRELGYITQSGSISGKITIKVN